MTRRSPYRHPVRTHRRDGYQVNKYMRGQGADRTPSFSPKKPRNNALLDSFNTLKKYYSFKYVDPTLGKTITVKYSKSISGEAQANTYKNEILLSDKFLKLNDDAKKNIFTHELGHFWESDVLKDPKDHWLVSDSGIFGEGKENKTGGGYYEGILGTFNVSEALAESYTIYKLEPQTLKRKHPKAYQFIKEISRGSSVKKTIEKLTGTTTNNQVNPSLKVQEGKKFSRKQEKIDEINKAIKNSGWATKDGLKAELRKDGSILYTKDFQASHGKYRGKISFNQVLATLEGKDIRYLKKKYGRYKPTYPDIQMNQKVQMNNKPQPTYSLLNNKRILNTIASSGFKITKKTPNQIFGKNKEGKGIWVLSDTVMNGVSILQINIDRSIGGKFRKRTGLTATLEGKYTDAYGKLRTTETPISAIKKIFIKIKKDEAEEKKNLSSLMKKLKRGSVKYYSLSKNEQSMLPFLTRENKVKSKSIDGDYLYSLK